MAEEPGNSGVASAADTRAVDAADALVERPVTPVELGLLRASPVPTLQPVEPAGAGPVHERAPDITETDVSTLVASLALPPICACCGAPASASRKLDLASNPGVLIVPLCDRCLTHEAVSRTRSLSTVLAAALIGGALALGLPLAFERLADSGTWQLSVNSWFSRWGIFLLPCGIVSALVGLRAVGWHFWSRLRKGDACAPGPAVALRQVSDDPKIAAVLRCAQASFAEQLFELNPGRLAMRAPSPHLTWEAALPRLGSRWIWGVLLFTALLSAGSFVIHRPRIQILNLTDHPLTLEVDGEVVARVPVTSQESAEAGVELRLPSGRRHFRALSNDQVVAEADLTLRGATRHLYAPASAGHCFWLERISYGRGNSPEPSPGSVQRLPLTSPIRFWAFPQAPDIWLAPPPEPLLDDARSSGGEVTALRQARCTDAPPDARPRG